MAGFKNTMKIILTEVTKLGQSRRKGGEKKKDPLGGKFSHRLETVGMGQLSNISTNGIG